MGAGLVMGFDYGTSRIGVAVGQSVTRTASPLSVVTVRNGLPDWKAIEALLLEWQPQLLIVGLPVNMDGTESEMSTRAARFARQLEGRFRIPAITMDERLTTREARELADGKAQLDALAAKLIIESWLREQPAG